MILRLVMSLKFDAFYIPNLVIYFIRFILQKYIITSLGKIPVIKDIYHFPVTSWCIIRCFKGGLTIKLVKRPSRESASSSLQYISSNLKYRGCISSLSLLFRALLICLSNIKIYDRNEATL